MKAKMIVKTGVDIGMTAALLFLMTYEMIGQAFHEWLGIGLFLLFVIHHVLNRRWFEVLLKGKYTLFRIWQTVLVMSVLLSMIGSMVSGVIISRSVLSFLPIHGESAFWRKLHMLSAYWSLVLMSLHLGLHWNMMLGAAGKAVKGTFAIRICILRIAAAVVALYGMYAFVKRDIGDYMAVISSSIDTLAVQPDKSEAACGRPSAMTWTVYDDTSVQSQSRRSGNTQ